MFRPLHRSRLRASQMAEHPQTQRRGAAVVEMAFIAPVFFLLVIGIVEFGRLLMVQQIVTNASREGARRAIIESATESEVKQLVGDYLADTSVSGATVTVTPTGLTGLGMGDPVTVSVSIPYSDVSWMPESWFLGGTTIKATTIMRAERLQ